MGPMNSTNKIEGLGMEGDMLGGLDGFSGKKRN